VQQLGFAGRIDAACSLQFQKQGVFDHLIGLEAADDGAAKRHLERYLAGYRHAFLRPSDCHGLFIDGFEESVA
jgi:hypothetical protein